MQDLQLDSSKLEKLVRTRMPFGRYEGSLLINLPENYLLWFSRKGFPSGELGELMALCLEIRINGLESMVRKLAELPTLH